MLAHPSGSLLIGSLLGLFDWRQVAFEPSQRGRHQRSNVTTELEVTF
jgi:hypothetical protein